MACRAPALCKLWRRCRPSLNWPELNRPGLVWAALILLVPALLFLLFLLSDRLAPLHTPAQQGRHFAQLVVDANGQPLRVFPDERGVWRYPVQLDEVSPLYLQALINYEDRWFYHHPGVNPLALVRALGQRLYHGRTLSGGSTLSMQVARILHPHKRTLGGKLVQMFRALQLEWHYSKDEILTLYLNQAPFGGTVEGVQAASYTYLGKSAAQLSHAEAALLAVLPQRPTALRPDRNPERATQARNKVIRRMADFAQWRPEDVREALAEPLAPRAEPRPMLAPLLASRLARQNPGQPLIETNIHAQLQAAIQNLVGDYIRPYPAQTSAAVLVIDNEDLSVRAYQGSARFGDEQRAGYLDMATAQRSPGSTLKPFLYAMALDEGLIHSESLLLDVPSDFDGYRPHNFDSHFSGPVSASAALQRSLNLPAVQLLAELGPETFYARLANAGLELRMPPRSRPNLSLVLGGASVTLENLASAYTALGRDGMAGRPRLQPSDPRHDRRLMSAGAAWVVQDSLRAPLARSGNLHRQTLARTPTTAYKTGTSYGYRDAWALTSTEALTLAVWIGRPDGTALPHNTGRLSAVPLLEQLVQLVTTEQLQAPPRPSNVARREICWPLGGIRDWQSNDQCQRRRHAWLIDNTAPPTLKDPLQTASDTLTRNIRLDQSGQYQVPINCSVPVGDTTALTLWPASLEPWLPERWQRNRLLPAVHPQCPQTSQQRTGKLVIEGLDRGSIVSPRPGEQDLPGLTLEARGVQGEGHWFLDGQWLGTTENRHQWRLEGLASGDHQVSVLDQAGKFDMIEFRVEGVVNP